MSLPNTAGADSHLKSPDSAPRWDLFCAVVDNYGDIGVAWRLARQLVAEHGVRLRLWVDDLKPFARICPVLDTNSPVQFVEAVEVRLWAKPFQPTAPADVVIEAFACALPEAYVEAMAVRPQPPVWINLEYLTAEDWILGCHGLPSPHPLHALTKHFFFPGWQPEVGGVLREAGLKAERQRFQADAEVQAAFWRGIGVPEPQAGELRVSLFAYANRAIPALLAAWQASGTVVRCLVPEGPALQAVAQALGAANLAPGGQLRAGSLIVQALPMLEQRDYDRLLWACDCNFVRGEDSFVRAQWAAQPFVWQAYPQDEAAHWPKIEAFLRLYCAGLDPETARTLEGFWRAWNAEALSAADWPAFWNMQPMLRRHALHWADSQAERPDLASRLLAFVAQKRAAT